MVYYRPYRPRIAPQPLRARLGRPPALRRRPLKTAEVPRRRKAVIYAPRRLLRGSAPRSDTIYAVIASRAKQSRRCRAGTSLDCRSPRISVTPAASLGRDRCVLRVHLGKHRLAPGDLAREDLFDGARRIVAGIDPRRVAALLHGLDCLQQEAPRRDDRAVGRSQMLLRAVDDRPHPFLHSAVLGVDAVDAGIGLVLLDLSVDHPIVALVAERAELARLLDIVGAVAIAAFHAVFVAQPLLAIAVHPVPHHAVLVVDRDPDVAGDVGPVAAAQGAPQLLRPDLRERHHEMVGADIGLVVVERAYSDIAIAVIGDIHLKDRRPAADERALNGDAGAAGVLGDRAVQDRRVRGVDAAFERLQPVALFPNLRDVAVGFRDLRPLESRRRRHLVARSHIGPDHPAYLGRRIGGQADLVTERLRLVHLLDAIAFDVELPAVIDAAQAGFLVASEPQGGAAMRAKLLDEPDAALAVAKTDELLAEQLHAHRRAVGLGEFARQEGRNPIPPQHIAHRRARSYSRHQLVLFARQHRVAPLFSGDRSDHDNRPIGRPRQEPADRHHRQPAGFLIRSTDQLLRGKRWT